MGLLMSDVKHDYIKSKLSPLSATKQSELERIFRDLEAEANAELHDEGFTKREIAIERALDLRYAGQGYEVTIPCGSPATAMAELRANFDKQHEQMFGHTAPDEPVEIVSYRVRGIGRVPPVKLKRYEPSGLELNDALRETRRARFAGVTLDCPVYQRERLDVGMRLSGPAIIDQLDATTVIPSGQTARVDAFKNLLITIGAA